MELTISTSATFVPQEHIRNFHGISPRPVFFPEAVPDVVFVDILHSGGEFFHEVLFDAAESLNEVEVKRSRRSDK